MKSAGLNPILAYQRGGASSPGGSSYSPMNVGAAGVEGGYKGASGATSAKEAETKRGKLTLEESYQHETLRNLRAKTRESGAKAVLDHDTGSYHRAQERLTEAQIRGQNFRNLSLDHETHSAAAEARAADIAKANWETDMGEMFRQLGLYARDLNPFFNSAKGMARRR